MGKRKDDKKPKLKDLMEPHFRSMDSKVFEYGRSRRKKKRMKVETTEEFLARGGEIKQFDMNGKEIEKDGRTEDQEDSNTAGKGESARNISKLWGLPAFLKSPYKPYSFERVRRDHNGNILDQESKV